MKQGIVSCNCVTHFSHLKTARNIINLFLAVVLLKENDISLQIIYREKDLPLRQVNYTRCIFFVCNNNSKLFLNHSGIVRVFRTSIFTDECVIFHPPVSFHLSQCLNFPFEPARKLLTPVQHLPSFPLNFGFAMERRATRLPFT